MSLDVQSAPSEKPIVEASVPLLPWITWFSKVRDILSALTLSGPTSARPTSLLWVGRPFWDETLQTPVYLASVEPNVWKQVAVTAALVTPTETARPQAPASRLVVEVSTATNIAMTAVEILLDDAAGIAIKLTNVSLSAVMPTDLDVGTETASTWYYIWLISNGTTPRLLISASPTAPTMPAGYTHKGLLSAVRNDSSSNFRISRTHGRYTGVVGGQILGTGTASSITAVSVNLVAPPEGRIVSGFMQVNATVAGARELIISMDSSARAAQVLGDDTAATATTTGNFRVGYISSEIWYRVTQANNQAFITVTGWEF